MGDLRLGFTRKLLTTLVVLLALAWAGATGAPIEKTGKVDVPVTDLELYQQISKSVRSGEGYYEAAIRHQRQAEFPLQPASTVRIPTLAYLTTLVPPHYVTVLLLVANILAWVGRMPGTPAERAVAGVLLAVGGFLAFDQSMAYLHDLWAGLLLSLALVSYSEERWWPTWLFAALALAIREHAIVFAALFGALSLYRQRWPETIAWMVLGAVFLAGTTAHYLAVAQLVTDTDKASDGWLWLLGPKAFLNDILALTLLRLLPNWLSGPLAILPFLGWAILNDKRPLIVFTTFAILFCFVGREDNFYWGFLVLPAYLAGLALVPRAIIQFWKGKPQMVGADGLEPPTLSV